MTHSRKGSNGRSGSAGGSSHNSRNSRNRHRRTRGAGQPSTSRRGAGRQGTKRQGSDQRPSRQAAPAPAPAATAAADTSVTFADLGIGSPSLKSLKAEGIVHPFPIQAQAIPAAVEGRDILGRGPTGSGKTFTFGLPIIEKLRGGASTPGRPRAVILAPTRELATQIRKRIEPAANANGQRVLEVVGGVKISRHLTALARPVDILVATPGRAEDLLTQGALGFDQVDVVALDEADHMADMGFLPQVRKLLDRMPKNAQHLLFSATLDGDVQVLVKQYMNDPVTFSTGEGTATVDRMDHFLGILPAPGEPDKQTKFATVEKLAKLSRPGDPNGRIVMFMRTKWAVDRQVKKLVKAGVTAVGLHGNKGQNARVAALTAFSSGEASVLVATDIAARGIDISDVGLVVHIDPPAEHKAYVHRAGRTARAGNTGTVVTLTFADDQQDTLKIMKKAGVMPEVLAADELIAEVSGTLT